MATPQRHEIGLHPVFWTHVRLLVCDVHRLARRHGIPEEIYWFYDHPVRRVEILGIVVSVEVTGRGVVYTIDDGTGIVQTMRWNPRGSVITATPSFSLGSTVRVQGRVSEYQYKKQITVNFAKQEDDPSVHTFWWMKTTQLRERVYTRKFRIARPDFYSVSGKSGGDAMSVDEVLAIGDSSGGGLATDPRPPDDETFRDKLLSHIKSHNVDTFDYLQLRSDPALEAMALSVVTGMSTTTTTTTAPSDSTSAFAYQRVNAVFTRAIHHLVREGDVALVDRNTDRYQVISHDGNLLDFIRSIIRQKEGAGGSGAPGEGDASAAPENTVKVDRLLIRVKETKMFERISRKKVLAALSVLEEAGEMYEVGKGEFRLT